MSDDSGKRRSSTWERAYPEDLKKSEERLVCRRHGKCDSCGDSAETGLALSGGGIRSATFGFGVIQALAGLDLLPKIDVLSTVSGGGYTGSLLSRLFTRKEVKDHEDVKRVILPPHASDDAPQEFPSGWVLRWLRENGRYLAPNGSGDLLLGGAIALRNWLSIHLVLTTLALTLFVAMQCIRNGLHIWSSGATVPLFLTCSANGATGAAPLADLETWLSCRLPLGETYVWWSPWLLLPAFIFVFAAVPLGWAYWLLADDGRQTPKGRSGVFCAICGPVIVVAGATLVYAATRILDIDRLAPFLPAATVFLFVAVVTIFVALFSVIRRRYHAKDADDAPNYRVRHSLSSGLKTALVLFAVTLGLAVVDSLGQTVYVMWEDPEFSIAGWLAGMLGLVTVAVNARRVVAYFSDRSGDRLRPSFDLVALMVAALLFCVTLTVTNALSHGIAWSFKYPYHVPEKLVTRTPTEAGRKAALTQSCSLEESPCPDSAELGGLPCTECPEPGERCLLGPAGVLGFLAVLSFVFGHTWPFLNNSTLLPLYSARLTRAYLGASNPCRVSPRRKTPPPQGKEIEDCPPPVAVTRVTPGDDMSIEKCWWKRVEPQDEDPFKKGAPLHLVNVTINETLAGESQVQHGDRKGIGMAIGPAGISAGVQHHVVFRKSSEDRRLATIFPKAQTRKAGETAIECRPFRMFAYDASSTGGSEGEVRYAGRPLSLGQWTGISGAAFSTGLGLRTSLGLSLLAGFFNVRLGLWWDSGVDPGERGSTATRETGSGRLGRWVSWLLPVQSYLVDELLSRFHGVARRWWYLSDGGHFENTGAYELIRRQLPLIIIVDAAADPDYAYVDLANLVRKARTDFGAEIEFLDREGLYRIRSRPNLEGLKYFGSLEMLRRGPWDQEPLPTTDGDARAKRLVFGPPERPRHSSAHAALGFVRYESKEVPKSLIVYLKPTLLGDEPPDIASYHGSHPDFPQQATADQFFDEAQWESYRNLGQLIAERVFPRGLAPYRELLDNWPVSDDTQSAE